MAKINVYNMDGSVKEELELSEIFSLEYNEALIHQAVVTRLANERQGTKSTLTRSEVRGGGIKPWRQKGTGRARQGSIRAPQWIKGGVVFAPKSRDFSKKMNITAKRLALFSALSKKFADNEVVVLADLTVSGKTKEMVKVLNTFDLNKRTLLVMADGNELVRRSAANINTLSTLPVDQINTYDVVASQKILTTKEVIEKLQEVYGE
ncbi:MAG: 50S ribosomal protein L4 [Clostridiales bacterium]|nr:50S ribosomal protein L4 [Clostridiales bacterium]